MMRADLILPPSPRPLQEEEEQLIVVFLEAAQTGFSELAPVLFDRGKRGRRSLRGGYVFSGSPGSVCQSMCG